MECRRAVALVILSFVTAACGGRLFRISEPTKPGEGLPGVPFLPIVAIDEVTAFYHQTWTEVRFSVTRGGPEDDPEKHHTATTVRYIRSPGCAQAVLGLFADEEDAGLGVEAVGGYLLAVPPEEPPTDGKGIGRYCKPGFIEMSAPAQLPPDQVGTSSGLVLASIERERKQVPGHEPLYFNADRALAGSSSATLELNANGTLSKAGAEVEDKLLETVLASLPVSAAASAVLGLPVDEADEGARGTLVLAASIELVPITRVYAVRQQSVASSALPAGGAPPTGASKGVQVVVATARADKKAAEEDASSRYEFTGSVKLPKSSGEPES